MNEIGLQALINKGDARAKQLRKELEVEKSKIRFLEIKIKGLESALGNLRARFKRVSDKND